MKNVYLHIPDYNSGPLPLALATVISTKGSTPRKPGSSALFGSKGLLWGTVGGGVLEGRVQKIAQEAAITGKSGIYHFELNKDISFKNEAICGGQATVLIDAALPANQAFFEQVKVNLREKKRCVMVAVIFRLAENELKIDRFLLTSDVKSNLPKQYEKRITTEVNRLLASSDPDDYSMIYLGNAGEEDSVTAFLEPLFHSIELVIVGAGHIGKALSHLGKILDFEVTVIDNRPEFANSENLPDADHIVVENIGPAVKRINKSSHTYIVIVTRGHEDDANALKECIGSSAAYIGMIGSRTKVEQMHRNFIENGWASEKQWASIHAPIGLDILSETVEEIALSIAAEIVLERNKRAESGKVAKSKT